MRALLCALLLGACASAAAPAGNGGQELRQDSFCDELDAIVERGLSQRATQADEIRRVACQLPVDDVDAAAAQAALGDRFITTARSGDTLTVFAQGPPAGLDLCCSLQTPMTRLGDSRFYAARYRLADLDRAMLWFVLPMPNAQRVEAAYRGPDAPPTPEVEGEIEGSIIEATLRSVHLRETRRLVVYLPPNHRAGADHAVLVVADGSAVRYYARVIEPMIDRGEIAPLVLLGVVAGQPGIVEDRSALNVDLRAADYLPGWSEDRFAQHQRFVIDELLPFAEREYAITRERSRRGVAGFSNGGVFAFWSGLLRPDVFGIVIARSTGYSRSMPTRAQIRRLERARFLMSAGLYETRFWRTTRDRAEMLRAAGYDVTFRSIAAGHAPDQGNVTFAEFVRAAFAAGS